jgi:hypothetical protein
VPAKRSEVQTGLAIFVLCGHIDAFIEQEVHYVRSTKFTSPHEGRLDMRFRDVGFHSGSFLEKFLHDIAASTWPSL